MATVTDPALIARLEAARKRRTTVTDPELIRRLEEARRGPEKTLAGFGENVLSSGKQFGQEIWDMVSSPVDTAKNVGALAAGGLQKFADDDGRADALMKQWFGNHEGVADAAGQFYKDRYGGMDNIADTAYEDPVGLLSDLAMVFGGGLKTAGSLANKVGKTGNVVAKTLTRAGKVADGLDALNLGVGAATKGASKLRGGAKYAVNNTLENAKFSTTLPEAQRARMAQTLLENGLDPTNPKSVQKMEGLLNKAEEASKQAIDQFDADGGVIDAMPAVDNMRGVLADEGKLIIPEQQKRVKTVEKLIDSTEEVLAPTQGQLSGRQALDSRRAVDASIDWKAKGAKQTARNQALKAYANGLREQLAESVKGLDGVNKDYSKLVEAADPLRRSTARNANNSGSLTSAVLGGIGTATSMATGNLMPLAVSIVYNKSLKPATRQRLAQFVFDRSSKGARSVSDKALSVEIMRVIQEIEQSTGQNDEQ